MFCFTGNMKVSVYNVPDYAYRKKYWVCNIVSNELWFYAADDDKKWIDDTVDSLEEAIMIENPEVE